LQKILEVGTGCGYQAAVLASIFREVTRSRAHQGTARARAPRISSACGSGILRLGHGDGYAGLEKAAPFQSIIVAAAGGARFQMPCYASSLRVENDIAAARAAIRTEAQRAGADRAQRARFHRVRARCGRFVPMEAGKHEASARTGSMVVVALSVPVHHTPLGAGGGSRAARRRRLRRAARLAPGS